jgi:anti-sigma factor RsiW
MGARELDCRGFIDFILAYLEGELDAGTRARFERHLEACADCVAYLDSYRRTVELGREALRAGAGDEPVPAEVPAELVRAVLAARRKT